MCTKPAVALLAGLLVLSAGAHLVSATEYQLPSQPLIDIVDAPTTPLVRLDPARTRLLLMAQPSLPAIADLAQRELRLAGMRIRPQIFGPSRGRYSTGLAILPISGGAPTAITGLPEPAHIENVAWSPDGRHIAFTCTIFENGVAVRIEPWVASADSGRARRLAAIALNLTAHVPPVWLPDSSGLVAVAVPAENGAEPAANPVPTGPTIEESVGRKAPARTYQDLLTDADDEALFEHYFTGQIVEIGLDSQLQRRGDPAIVWDLSVSPSGELLLVETVHRPYSYRVPMSRFPRRIEVRDRRGGSVHELADLPLQEEVPMTFGSVPTGPRSVTWRADAPATLVWVEALDGGDGGREASERDRLFRFTAPFSGEPQQMQTLALRFAGIDWGNDEVALVREMWRKNRKIRTWRIHPGDDSRPPELIEERSYEDRYSDPGRALTRRNQAGRSVLRIGPGGTLARIGAGASPDGDRPFVDTFDLAAGSKRWFRSQAPFYELPVDVLEVDDNGRPRKLLTRRESIDEPPNYYVRDLRDDSLRQITDFAHPTPQLLGVTKTLVQYQRADGVDLTATLYLPPGYQPEQGPLPMLMWAYPREYKSAAAAGQVRDSPYRFARITREPLIFLAMGFAVFDNPAMPIIGEGEAEPNDTYVEQLVASASAAVDEVVRRGIAERDRIAVGGHSYGAFMTANLLAHSDLFAAGIARSGAYNRTLTPFGFQAEERSVWERPEIYFAMSPFMHAEKVNEPILLIHGEADNNSGTFPLQSRRYYAALKGLGAVARLVMLPHESHGYRARESVLHTLWEQEQWLERYVRAPGEAEVTSSGR